MLCLYLLVFCHRIYGSFLPVKGEKDEAEEGDEEGDEACCLGTGEYQKGLFRIVAAQKFQPKTHNTVKHDVERKSSALCVWKASIEKKQGKDDDIELTLPDLCGPERLIAVRPMGKGRSRVQYAETAARRSAECIAVSEVGRASQCLPENDRGRDDVEKVEDIEPLMTRVKNAGDDAEEDAALNCHAALPDI